MSDRRFSDQVANSLRSGAELRLALEATCGERICEAGQLLITCLRAGRKVLFCGNGGSAADSQHLAAEFVGRFTIDRAPLPAIALTTDTSLMTAVGNDYGFDHVFERQVRGLGQPGDVLVGISTSGKSLNVLMAATAARTKGMKVIGLCGGAGGPLAEAADIGIVVPSAVTARIQECHLTIGHILCELVELDMMDPRTGEIR